MEPKKAQFNVYLPPELIRRIKHAAIDDDAASLSEYVEQALTEQLARRRGRFVDLLPILYVSDISAAEDFLRQLGLEIEEGRRDRRGTWQELRVGGARLGLHLATTEQHPPGATSLDFESLVPLNELAERLRAVGVAIDEPIIDETFGRSLVLRGPDGQTIYIGEHDPDLYE